MRQRDEPADSPAMPGDTRSARRLVLATAGLLALGGAGFIQQGMVGGDMTYGIPFTDSTYEVSTSAFTALGLLVVSFCAAGLLLASRFVAGAPDCADAGSPGPHWGSSLPSPCGSTLACSPSHLRWPPRTW